MAVKTPFYDMINWRQRRFVDLYVDLKPKVGRAAGAEAVRQMGHRGSYPRQVAWRYLKQPEVQEAIEERKAMVAELANIDSVRIAHTIQETIDRCRQAEPVLDRRGNPVFVETPDGKEAAAYVFDAKNVLKGAELLGSYLSMWKQRTELTGANGGPVETRNVDQLTDEQLEAIARRGRSAPAEPEEGED